MGVSKMHTIHHKKYFHPLGANHLEIKFLRERSEHSAKKAMCDNDNELANLLATTLDDVSLSL